MASKKPATKTPRKTSTKAAAKAPKSSQKKSPLMPDVQGSADVRGVAINKVGVKDVRYPITLKGQNGNADQHTVAMVNMYVALPKEKKGTHMSRFLEVLNEHHEAVDAANLLDFVHIMRERLHASEAHLELEFPYFITKQAPVTGQRGKMDLKVKLEAVASSASKKGDDFILTIRVPATSLCPCSKEISRYGAHNQRCEMEASVRFKKGRFLSIEELVAIVEKCASTQVFAVLKRLDEKFVTEDAYDNPKFVEDIVRDLTVALDKEKNISWFRVASENFESIHNHNAYAVVEKDKRKK